MCTVCGKSLVAYAKMSEHMRLHTGDRPHLCDICEKALTTKQRLQAHKQPHHSDRLLHCDVCGYKTTKPMADFRAHVLSHADYKPLTCHICNKAFAHTTSLAAHMNNVHPTTTFDCPQCNKPFKTKMHMKRHVDAVHLGVKKCSCDICAESFANNSNWNRHMQRCH
jgi:KRAB domain-containing zinc finger protein